MIIIEDNNIMTFKVFHPDRQPQSPNVCNDNKCSHICIPLNETQYKCVCPTNSYMNHGGICNTEVSLRLLQSYY